MPHHGRCLIRNSVSRAATIISVETSHCGTIIATGGDYAAGIGGGNGGAGGEITISGENTRVTATGVSGGAGIGGGKGNSDGTITITGGTVKATNGSNVVIVTDDAHDIKGNTVVVGPDATMKTENGSVDYTYENGFVFSNNNAEVKGNATLLADIIIENGEELIIHPETSLTIEEGVTLTNNGTIENNGTIKGTITGNGSNSGNGKILIKLTESMVTIAPDTYTDSEVTPNVTVSYSSTTYEEDTDYMLVYDNNINAGTNATVTVTPTAGTNGKLYGDPVTKPFTIEKATPAAANFSFTELSDLVYNGREKTASVGTVSGITGMGTVTLNYYDGSGQEATPTNAGTYTVKISVTEGTNFKEDSDITAEDWKFTITKATPTADHFTFTAPTVTYDGQAKTATVEVKEGITGMGTTITINYYDGGTLLPSAPTGAGTYTVKINVADGTNYTAGSGITADSWTFEITKAKPTFPTDADWTVSGKVYDSTPISVNKPTLTGIGNETIPEDKVTLTYYLSDGTTNTTTANSGTASEGAAPVWAGNYQVKANYAGNGNLDSAETSATFSITQADNNWTTELSMNDWTYGETPNDPSAAAAQGSVTYTYYSKAADSNTYTPLTNKPTDAGTWYVQASVTNLANYKDLTSEYVAFTIAQAAVELTFAQPTLTITQGDAVPDNALTKPDDCTVTYSSDNEEVATVNATTGIVTVVGVGTATITATAVGNYTGSASYTLTVNSYIPPTPDPDPVYYTVTIPTEVAGAIIYGGGTQTVEEYTYCSFSIELDPNGSGEYPTVTKDYAWNTLTPDGEGNYSFMVTGDTEISISEVPTSSYSDYQLTFPTDSVAESDSTYWSGAYIEVIGASQLRAEIAESIDYEAPFGTTVTLRPIETAHRKFLQWEDGSKRKEHTLTLRVDQEIKALWQSISPVDIETIAANSVIRGERGQLYIEVPNACEVVVYNYNGVPVRAAQLAAGANRLMSFNASLYLVKLGDAQAVPVLVR